MNERVILVYIVLFQNFLDAFTEAAESSFGCLFVDDKIVVATRKWWNLSANELVLLTLLISSVQRCSSRDVPIFLPDSHPTVSHSSGLTKPGEVGHFFALISMKSPNVCQKAKF